MICRMLANQRRNALGQRMRLTSLVRRRHQIDVALFSPAPTWPLSSKAEVFHIGALGGQSHARQTRRWALANGKQVCSQVLVMGAGRSKAKAGNDSHGSHAQQEMEAFVPANAITPADICLTGQPAQAASFGFAGNSGCTIQHLLETLVGVHQFNQIQAKGRDCITMLPHQPVELCSIR
jgi:hypothetical protein